jgi:hypothetical protein
MSGIWPEGWDGKALEEGTMKTEAPRRVGAVVIALILTGLILAAGGTIALGDPPTPASPGTLIITKQLVGSGAYSIGDFSVSVRGPKGYNEDFDFGDDGEVSGDDRVVTITGLEPGEYDIKEIDVPLEISVEGEVEDLVIGPGATEDVTITNTYLNPAEATETWLGEDEQKNGEEHNVCTYGGYSHWVIPGGAEGIVSAGIYVNYADGTTLGPIPSRETKSSTIHFDVYGGPGLIADAWVDYTYVGDTVPDIKLNLSHTRCGGGLTIEKVVENAPPGPATQFEFTLTLVTPDTSGPYGGDAPSSYQKTFELSADGSEAITGLWPGVYELEETDPGSEWTVSGTGSITVVAGEMRSATVTNTNTYVPPEVPTGTLTVIKSVEGGTLSAGDFTLEVTGTYPNGTSLDEGIAGQASPGQTFTLKAGTPYSVSEGAYENYEVSYIGDPTGDIPAGENVTVTVVNTYVPPEVPTGTLRIEKVLNDPEEQFTVDQFRVRVTGPEGYNQTQRFPPSGTIVLSGLAPGTYTVTEIGLPPTGTFNVEISGGGVVAVEGNQEAQVTVTNTRTVTSSTSTSPTSDEPTTTSESTTSTTGESTTTSSTDVGEVTTEPPTSTSTTAYPLTSVPTPSQIQTGGGGTAGSGAGMWSLAGLAVALGIGLSASALRGRRKAK